MKTQNAGRKNQKKSAFFRKILNYNFFLHISSSYAKILGEAWRTQARLPHASCLVQKSLKTMASYACNCHLVHAIRLDQALDQLKEI